MAAPSVQAAQRLIQKLIDTHINNPPIPDAQKRIFPVASLANGKLLLSNGEIRQTPVMENLQKMEDKKTYEGGTQSPAEYLSNLALNIAVPANKTGQDMEGRALAFANYLNAVLKPKLSAPQETGLPGMLQQQEIPQQNQSGAFSIPSALANLPKLAPKVEETIDETKLFKDFTNNYDFQDALKKDFARQFNPGEQETSNAQRLGSLPLVQGYGTAYRLPTAENAQYAQISANPFALTDRIR